MIQGALVRRQQHQVPLDHAKKWAASMVRLRFSVVTASVSWRRRRLIASA